MAIESSAATAFLVLSGWLKTNGGSHLSSMDEKNWMVTEFEDAFLFNPISPNRSNRLYFVRELEVIAFSPSVTSFDDAYGSLG